MKKIIISTFTLLSLLFSLGSCSSDENITETQPIAQTKQAVTIDIAGIAHEFKTEKASIKAATSDSCYLWYAIYKKSDGRFVKQKWIDKSDILVIKDSLEQGDYIYSVFASEIDLDVMMLFTGFTYDKAYADLGYFKELFYKTFEVNVGSSSTNVPVVLERIVSKITINIENPEEIPNEVTSIGVSGSWCPIGFTLASGQTTTGLVIYENVGIAFTEDISRKDILKAGSNQFVFYMLPTSSDYYKGSKQLDLKLTFNGLSTSQEARTITIKKDFRVDRNVSVILSGKIPPKVNSLNNINIDAEWDGNVVEHFDAN